MVNQPEPEEDKTNDKVKEFFRKIAGDDMEVDWIELKEILDYAMRAGNVKISLCNPGRMYSLTIFLLIEIEVRMEY